MSSTYCFKINNPRNIDIDVEALKSFVKLLYVGDGKDKFSAEKKIPLTVIYVQQENVVCVLQNGVGENNKRIIKKNNDSFIDKQLLFKPGIHLAKPIERSIDVLTWWGGNEAPAPPKGKGASLRIRYQLPRP